MAASESLRFDIVGVDHASDAFSKVGRSVGDMSGKMDGATKSAGWLDEAMKRQRAAAHASTDATLALAKSDEILVEVEKRLKDGALEAEFALKKEAEALKGVKREADRLDGKKVKIKVEVDRSAWSRFFGRGGGGSNGGSSSGGGFLSSLPAFSGLVNPYTIGAGILASPFAAQALGGGLIFGLGSGLAGLGIAGAFGAGASVTPAQLALAESKVRIAQLRLQAAQQASAKKSTPSTQASLLSAQNGLTSAQANLTTAKNDALSPDQLAARNSFKTLANDAQGSLSKIGWSFAPVMQSILTTADRTLKQMTPVFEAAVTAIAGPFRIFGDTLLKSFASPQVKTSIEAVAGAFGKILTALAPGIPGDVNEIATGITKIANAVAANPQAFATFVNDLFKIGQVALSVIADLIKTATYIEAHFRPALHRVAVIFDGVRHEIAHIWGDMLSALIRTWGATWNDTIGIAIRFGHNIETQFNSIRHGIAVVFDGMRHEIAHVWDLIWNNTIGREQRGVNDVVSWISKLPGRIAGVFKDAGTWLVDAGKTLVDGFINGIESMGSAVASALWGLVPSPLRSVISKVTNFFGAGYASGTASAPPGWAWVGERGPELMRFRGGEQVMSAPASSAYAAARGGGGATYVINVTVSPLARPADTGREVVNAIRAFEKSSGKSWRS